MEFSPTKCLICGKKYKYLGSHLWMAHHIKARNYKLQFGFDLNFPLISKEIQDKKRKAWYQQEEKYKANLNKKQKPFKKGEYARTYISKQSNQRETKKMKSFLYPACCIICRKEVRHIQNHFAMKHQNPKE